MSSGSGHCPESSCAAASTSHYASPLSRSLLAGTSLVWKVPGQEAGVGTEGTGIVWFARATEARVLGSGTALALVEDGRDGSELRVHRTVNKHEPALTVPLGRSGPGLLPKRVSCCGMGRRGTSSTADLDAGRLITVTRLG